MMREQLKRPVVIEVHAKQRQRLDITDKCRGEVTADHSDSLIKRLVITEARQPRHSQARRGELLYRATN